MTIIRATCPSCGKVEVGAAAISLEVEDGGELGQYRFACPSCTVQVHKQAGKQSVGMLVAAGVAVRSSRAVEAEAPARPKDDGVDRGAVPFTLDDAIDFHFLLQDDALLTSLFADER
jgi:hypothetical protein